MQFAFSRAFLGGVLLLASVAFGAIPKQQQQQHQQKQLKAASPTPAKLKRDAGLSFAGSSIFHGPSHKYLPPSGYEATYGSLHSNGLGASSGFDIAGLDADNSHYHQHYSHHQYNHHQPQAQHASALSSHHGHVRPVYITSGGYHHRQHPSPKVETFIVQSAGGGGAAGHAHHHLGNSLGAGGYKYSGHGGASYLSLLTAGHKQHGGGGGSGATYLLTGPSYSAGHAHGAHHAHVPSIASSHGIHLGGAPHYAAALGGHGLEHEEHAGGYNYEGPTVHYKQPVSSYGVPLLPGYEHSHHEDEEQHQHHEHHQQQDAHAQQPHQQSEQVHKSHAEQQTPVYALGHKGLGHFTYQSSKPHALNTDIHQISSTTAEDHNELLLAELGSKAPFKPSTFLGAKHEPSTSGGYDYATPTAQYLHQPATGSGSGGYDDYHSPAVLYGAPGHAGVSATPVFEPDSTYLPPVTSYGASAAAAAASSHSYH